MIADVREPFQRGIADLLGREVEISEPVLLAGGASKEAWSVDADGEPLLVRRAAVGVIHRHTLSLRDEYAILEVAHAAGVKVPRPYGYLADLAGREAFVMERLEGETIGRRIVQRPELERAREALPIQLAEEIAKIHAIPLAEVPFLEEARLERMVEELDDFGEPHPAIELGLWWLRENRPPARPHVLVHGDFRIGNVVVGPEGLRGVLDWEFAHLDEPVRDLAFGLVRAWRFGVDDKRLGGVGDAEPYLERYNELTGFDVRPEELDYWEVAGNVGWAIGCLTQAQRHLSGQDRSVELAILGRLGAEVEYEILHLLERKGVT
ncbi:MAG: phosphotransferase family protein [Actinobacteria bacterium]|nr:phosphotransferase family protein [Actinomycetota bacterium]